MITFEDCVSVYQRNPTESGLYQVFQLINLHCFNGQLPSIKIYFQKLRRSAFGVFRFESIKVSGKKQFKNSVEIAICEKIRSHAAMVVGSVAHECIHYWQGEILRRFPSHGLTFRCKARELEDFGFRYILGVASDLRTSSTMVAVVRVSKADRLNREFMLGVPHEKYGLHETKGIFLRNITKHFAQASRAVSVRFFLSNSVNTLNLPYATKALTMRKNCKLGISRYHCESAITEFVSTPGVVSY